MHTHTKHTIEQILGKCHYIKSSHERQNMNKEEKAHWGQLGRVYRGVKYSALGLLSGVGRYKVLGGP